MRKGYLIVQLFHDECSWLLSGDGKSSLFFIPNDPELNALMYHEN